MALRDRLARRGVARGAARAPARGRARLQRDRAARHAALDTLGRLVFAARRHAPGVLVCDFRGALPDTGASTVPRLGYEPLAARDALLSLLEAKPGSLDRALRDLAQV